MPAVLFVDFSNYQPNQSCQSFNCLSIPSLKKKPQLEADLKMNIPEVPDVPDVPDIPDVPDVDEMKDKAQDQVEDVVDDIKEKAEDAAGDLGGNMKWKLMIIAIQNKLNCCTGGSESSKAGFLS